MRLAFTPRARSDRNAIFDYLSSRSPDGARRVILSMDEAFALILAFPEAGQRISRVDTRVVMVPKYPYRIFYRVRTDRIDIIHIRHAARRPWGL